MLQAKRGHKVSLRDAGDSSAPPLAFIDHSDNYK
jgi:hypothetical protein